MNEFAAEAVTQLPIPWLSLLTFAPTLGALFIFLGRTTARRQEDGNVAPDVLVETDKNAKRVALLFTVGVFPADGGYQLVEDVPWFSGISYKLGVDGISVLFVLLTTFFFPICIIASWRSINHRVADYMIAFLILETLVLGVFCALDLIVFYLFFEGSLIPMFLIIGVWGSKGDKLFAGYRLPSRVYAAVKFFLYTFVGSVLMLVAILWMYAETGTTDVPALQ